MNSLVTERLKNCQTLPSPPGVALEILDLCREWNSPTIGSGA